MSVKPLVSPPLVRHPIVRHPIVRSPIVSHPLVSPDSLNVEKNLKTKLVYNDTLDTTSIQNILLISSKVAESQLFFDSANINTFPIIYSQNSAKNDLIELFRNKFQNGIKRIAFAFHDPLGQNVYWLDNKSFFDESDLIENQTVFSENVSFLTNLITEFKVKNCDFLACNSLQYSNWKKYYALLKKMTNVVCGASNDKTGNLQYGSDWVMENTNENIRDIYFTNSINNYSSSLLNFTVDYVNYSTSGLDATVTGFSSPPNPWNLTIPSSITDTSVIYTVTSIGDEAFYNCTNLTSVIIGSGVQSIGNSAFRSCYNLTSVIIPDSITSIGEHVFYDCTALTSVIIGSGVTTIGNYAFENCSALTSIIIPDSVTTIGNYAFYNCTNLTSVIIGSGVQSIGYNAFENCSALTSITIPDSVTTIGNYAFYDCTALTSVIIGSGVTSIGLGVFRSCINLQSITIPDSVTSIGNYAFYNCTNLTSVIIGSGVQSIGNSAFRSCYNLTSVIIPDSITSIGDNAFRSCYNLTSVIIGSGVQSIGIYAFENCTALTSVYFFGSVIPTINNNNFTRTNDTAYYVSGATAPSGTPDSYLSTFFSNRTILDVPTIEPWYPGGIETTFGVDTYFSLIDPSSNSSGAFNYTSSDPSVADVSGNQVTIFGIGTCTITASQEASGDYFPGSVETTLTVLSSGFTGPIIEPWYHNGIHTVLGDTPFSLIDPSSNSSGAFTYTSSDPSVADVSGNQVTIFGGGACTITASQEASGGFSPGSVETTLTVLSINPWYPGGIQKTYEVDTSFTLTDPSSNSSGAFTYTSSDPSVADVSGNQVTIIGGGTCTITASQEASGFYLAGSVETTLTVFTSSTINTWYPGGIETTFGVDTSFSLIDPSSNSSGAFTYTSSDPSVADVSGNQVTIIGGGTCTITASQAESGFYLAGSVETTLTVLSINPWYPNGIHTVLGNTHFSLKSPISNSSGAFTYTSSDPSVATISGNQVTIVGLGTSIITALQDASDGFAPGSTTTILTVNLKPPPPPPISNICFPAKTPVRTDQGLIHIDKINPELHTIHKKKIVAITQTVTQDKFLVCFEKDSLGTNIPSQKTIITPNHKIFYNGKMIKAKKFVDNLKGVKNVSYNGEVLYNVLLEDLNKMMVNNIIAETLDPKNSIAELYIKYNFDKLSDSDKIKLINHFNDYVIKNKVYSSSKK